MSAKPSSARLIIDRPLAGARNMSLDQAILESTATTGQTTLRFYQWTPATLSLGYFQKASNRELHAASTNCPIIRRASGGGAIVHDNELTYSLCIASGGSIAKANAVLYDTVHLAIQSSLKGQGINVSLYETRKGEDVKASKADPFLCFQRRAVGDLICDGAKVGGSAQRRLKNALIQHGSLLLSQSKFAPELPGLKELSGNIVDVDQLIQGITQQLAKSFSVEFVLGHILDAELSLAEDIEAEKFGAIQWLEKR